MQTRRKRESSSLVINKCPSIQEDVVDGLPSKRTPMHKEVPFVDPHLSSLFLSSNPIEPNAFSNSDMNKEIQNNQYSVEEFNNHILVLACFLQYIGPFYLSNVHHINHYHDECVKEGITPVRRLHLSRERKKKTEPEPLIQQANPYYYGELIPFQDQSHPISIPVVVPADIPKSTQDMSHPVESPQYCIPPAIVSAVPTSLDSIYTEELARSNESIDIPISDHPLMPTHVIKSNDIIPSLYSFVENLQIERPHTRKWKAVSPREYLLYISSFVVSMTGLSEIPSNSTFSSVSNLNPCSLSRDRKTQIKRLTGLQNTEELEAIIETISKQVYSDEILNQNCFNNQFHPKTLVSEYVEGIMQRESLNEVLTSMITLGIGLTAEQQNHLESMRKTEKNGDIVLLFVTHFAINAAYLTYIHMNNLLKEQFTLAQYQSQLHESINWLNTVSLSLILPPDVHFLVENPKSKLGALRRQCINCSPRGSKGKKRTKYMCLQCSKPFCNNDKCFEQFHHQNGFKYYKYSTI